MPLANLPYHDLTGPLVRGVGEGGGVSFSPRSLFRNGELGAVHLVDDFAYLWQDTAGTVPVTAIGQTVKRINDRTANGVHVTNATGWVLARTDSGYNYLVADGVSAFSASYTQTAYPLTLACAAQATANQQGSPIALYRATSEYYAIEKSTVAGEWKAYDRQGVSILTSAETSGDNNTPHVLLAQYASASFNLREDATDATAATTNTNTFGAPVNLLVGSTRSGSLFFKGNFFGSVVLARALTTTERTNLEGYLASKCGMYLNAALAGKTIAFVGDSITENGDYPARTVARLGAKALKFGFGGCRLANNAATGDGPYYDPMGMHNLAACINTGVYTSLTSGADALFAYNGDDNRPQAAAFAAQNWANVSHMAIFFGTNDWSGDVPLGTATDSDGSTFLGAVNYVTAQIHATYPSMKLAFIGPMFRSRNVSGDGRDSDTYPNDNGAFLLAYSDALAARAIGNGDKGVSFYRSSGINADNAATYLVDGLHPTSPAGYQRVADALAGFLNSSF